MLTDDDKQWIVDRLRETEGRLRTHISVEVAHVEGMTRIDRDRLKEVEDEILRLRERIRQLGPQ